MILAVAIQLRNSELISSQFSNQMYTYPTSPSLSALRSAPGGRGWPAQGYPWRGSGHQQGGPDGYLRRHSGPLASIPLWPPNSTGQHPDADGPWDAATDHQRQRQRRHLCGLMLSERMALPLPLSVGRGAMWRGRQLFVLYLFCVPF